MVVEKIYGRGNKEKANQQQDNEKAIFPGHDQLFLPQPFYSCQLSTWSTWGRTWGRTMKYVGNLGSDHEICNISFKLAYKSKLKISLKSIFRISKK
jgi:hypothetical protein